MRLLAAAARVAVCLSVHAAAFECDPYNSPQVPTNLHVGEKCGGWCGALGTCTDGLHCDRGLLPLAFLPMGSPLDTACRDPNEDNLLWTHLSWNATVSCAQQQWLSVSSDEDVDVLSYAVLGALSTSPVFRIDSYVRILSAKRCQDILVVLIERIDEPSERFVLTTALDGSANTLQPVT